LAQITDAVREVNRAGKLGTSGSVDEHSIDFEGALTIARRAWTSVAPRQAGGDGRARCVNADRGDDETPAV